MLIYLTKNMTDGRMRYYKIFSSQNLFGEYFVRREYGNKAFKKPTGYIETLFSSFEDANQHFSSISDIKQHRGYSKNVHV